VWIAHLKQLITPASAEVTQADMRRMAALTLADEEEEFVRRLGSRSGPSFKKASRPTTSFAVLVLI
jgi:hypothetical protein